jgi:hypothetical protein
LQLLLLLLRASVQDSEDGSLERVLTAAAMRRPSDTVILTTLNSAWSEPGSVLDGVDFSGQKNFMTDGYLRMMWRRVDFLREVLEKGFSFVFTVMRLQIKRRLLHSSSQCVALCCVVLQL